MSRRHSRCLGAVLLVALALSGCAHSEPPSAPPSTSLTSSAAASARPTQASDLPPAEALTDVLYRLADPAVPGAQKLDLIQGAQPSDADTLDRFVTALKDSGYFPLNFTASDIAWSDREPGAAVANVDVDTANPERPRFFFPMEFNRHGDGWQLSRTTAEMLLAFGNSR